MNIMNRKMLDGMLIAALLFAGVMVCPVPGEAGVNLNITIPLPGLEIVAPPAMVVIPGTYAYYAPDVEADLFFYHGYWYRPYQGGWYYSLGYNGPWGRVTIGNVPPPLVNLRPDYRNIPDRYGRMPYGTVQRNWRQWEEERYWDSYERGDEQPAPRHGRGMGMGMGMGMGGGR
jgi:hypothetical protein